MFFWAHPLKDSSFELKSPTNMSLSERLFMVWKREELVNGSKWAVNGSQNEVLVMRKFKVDCQGFVVGYVIEIFIPIFFVDD